MSGTWRERFWCGNRGRGRRSRFVYPRQLQVLPAFFVWVLEEVHREQQLGMDVPTEVVDTARGPLSCGESLL